MALVGMRLEAARIFGPSRTIMFSLAFCVLAKVVDDGLHLGSLVPLQGPLPLICWKHGIRLRLFVLAMVTIRGQFWMGAHRGMYALIPTLPIYLGRYNDS